VTPSKVNPEQKIEAKPKKIQEEEEKA